jgi:hypothetical protein
LIEAKYAGGRWREHLAHVGLSSVSGRCATMCECKQIVYIAA